MTRNPLVGFLYVLAIFSGVAYFANPTTASGAVEAAMPMLLLVCWYGLLCLGGVVGIIGWAWRDRLTGLLIERAAQGPLAAAAGIYCVSVLVVGGTKSIVVAGMALALGTAAIWRARQITRTVHGGGGHE